MKSKGSERTGASANLGSFRSMRSWTAKKSTTIRTRMMGNAVLPATSASISSAVGPSSGAGAAGRRGLCWGGAWGSGLDRAAVGATSRGDGATSRGDVATTAGGRGSAAVLELVVALSGSARGVAVRTAEPALVVPVTFCGAGVLSPPLGVGWPGGGGGGWSGRGRSRPWWRCWCCPPRRSGPTPGCRCRWVGRTGHRTWGWCTAWEARSLGLPVAAHS